MMGLNLAIISWLFFLPEAGGFTPWLFVSVVRDWLPAPLIVVGYREAGRLTFPRPDRVFENAFLRWDKYLFGHPPFRSWFAGLPRWLDGVLEFAYLQCYPIVPAGIAILYLAREGRFADYYWSVVLPAVFVSYGLTPLFPALPPRLLSPETPSVGQTLLLRKLNFWVHDHAGIRCNTFPSGHVAGAMAASFVLIERLPVVGVLYLAIATGITLGAVRGGYHYVVDASLGIIVAAGAFLIASVL
jgi:membrane-associated phospholipid phosphatase